MFRNYEGIATDLMYSYENRLSVGSQQWMGESFKKSC